MIPQYARFKPLRYAIIGFLVLAIVLSGCTQNNASNNGGSSQPSQSAPPGQSSSGGQSQQQEAEGAQYGGVLKIAFNRSPISLGYPGSILLGEESIMALPAMEHLVRVQNGTIEPWLAESWEEDPDSRTITFHLRKGIQFHDGTAFNAEAVKWNIDEFIASGRNQLQGLESVEVVDEYTVVVHLEEWLSHMLDAIGTFVKIASPTAIQANGKEWAEKNPVGTGPFIFESWEPDVKVTYKKNENYWDEGKPYLDGIEFLLISDPMTASAAFQSKDVHAYMYLSSDVARDLQAQGAVMTNFKYLLSATGIVGNSVDPNSPFADPRVRKAVGHAVDEKAISEALHFGFATPINQWGPEGSWSHNPNVKGTPYDPEKAKQLLAEAGYPDGLKTTLITNSTPIQKLTAETVQAYLKEVGIDAEIIVYDQARYQQLSGGVQSTEVWEGLNIYSGRHDANLGMYMPAVFSAKGTVYFKGIGTPEYVREMLSDLQRATTQEEMQSLAHELQRVIYDELHLITPLFATTTPGAKHPELQDDGFDQGHRLFWSPEKAWLKQ